MKLLVDMFACQTGSRFRGIGRYTISLVRELINLKRENQITLLADPLYQDSFENLRQEFTRKLSLGSFLPYYHLGLSGYEDVDDPIAEIAGSLGRQAYQVIAPDVVLYPSVFEGWGEQGCVPLPLGSFPNAIRAAIVYDFIPFVFKEQFLDPDPIIKQRYLKRMNSYRDFDLLLAISESTRQDVIKFLDIDESQVINISAAISHIFRQRQYPQEQIDSFLNNLGITKPFIFYTGNSEYHKNINGLLNAYSKLPYDIRCCHQLVLTNVGNRVVFNNLINSFGLCNDEIIPIEQINDEALIELYNLCKLYVFPSLYEGFGLPILEAMACGAPVIAANNSSIPEVIGRSDAMFNALNLESITNALHFALTNDDYRRELSSYGLERVKQFSWENIAIKVWQAFEKIYSDKIKFKSMPIPEKSNRKRIAFVSPLPPQKSGIAYYSAGLLPYIMKYFDIDLFSTPELKVSDDFLNANFKFFPWTELINHRGDYETVVYHMGNSEFHIHMLPLIKEMPGVVVQHDFFLSNLGFINEFINGEKDAFIRSMEINHGMRGVIDYVKSGIDAARQNWPMNWEILKYAQEIIVHSDHQKDLLNTFYRRGWMPNVHTIKQYHQVIPEITPFQKQTIRKKLGIAEDDFICCSFGFMAPTKLDIEIIQAFVKVVEYAPNMRLYFVGESEKGDYGNYIKQLIQEYRLNEKIINTEFVTDELYKKYLCASDIAIQLRTGSRGETSRAVLDCLAYGLPTIINAHGSMDDYEDEVIKLSDPLKVDDLVQMIQKLYEDKDFRETKKKNALTKISYSHAPEIIADQYAQVINHAIETNETKLFSSAIISFEKIPQPEPYIDIAAKCAAKNFNLRSQPRILIDVSDIAGTDWRGGIQRVLKNYIKEFFHLEDKAYQFELIRVKDEKIYHARRFAECLFGLNPGSMGEEILIDAQPGDLLFMLDSSWGLYAQFLSFYQDIRSKGGKIATILHDLIPIHFPEYCNKVVLDVFQSWLNIAITESDLFICVSKTVADDLITYIDQDKIRLKHTLDIAFVYSGAEIPVVHEKDSINKQIIQIQSSSAPLFLMVGTLEPRKGHSFVLDAFDQLWQQGYEYRLCIVGKMGWDMEQIYQRIMNHPEINKKLFYFENASDKEVNFCYTISTALISASFAEGFGLPIVEAAYHKIPAIVSDIPVFHEVGGEGVIYFSLDSPTNLARAIILMANLTLEERLAMAQKIKIFRWKESAGILLEILQGRHIYKILHPNIQQ